MNCPNCGNDVNENQKFCSKCGTEIAEVEIIHDIETLQGKTLHAFVKSKSFIISAIVLFVFVLISISAFACNKIYNNIKNDIHVELPSSTENYSKYKSIKSSYYEISNMTARETLENIIQQENDLKEFLSQKHNEDENSKLFTTFYGNVIAVSEKLNEFYKNNNVSLDNKNVTVVENVLFIPNNVNRYDLTGYYSLAIPNTKTNLFRTTFAIVNDNIEPNYTYIYNQYSKYLTKPYTDYLNHKMQYQVLRKDCALWVYEHRNEVITKEKLMEYLLFLRNLLNKYPNFGLWYYVQCDIKIYLDALLFEDWKMPNEPPIKNVLADFLKVAQKDTYEYDVVKELSNLNTDENNYDTSWEAIYRNWYDETFNDDNLPIITQYDINMHTKAESKYKQKIFNTKVQAYKDLKLNDNGALTKYINDFNKRKNNIELIVFPAKNNNPWYEYGSSYPVQFAALENAFNDLELYTYQKIADTYKNNYEHGNKLKVQAYHDYYNQVVQKISNSEYFAKDMQKYINGYDTRKNLYREIVSNKMKDTDFLIWFDKLELYTYHVILTGLCHLGDFTDEIQHIFEQ